ncbi:receptor-activated Ca2+-permeable cation channel [Guyanagaster necrorhizus]|uniref:Receptor-activated Ca2+-permeable cation channel n=1 Tax=Guyanagaster necrorhizus TaxID=856835 RepID=A0A9P7VQG2_9AGAR|nr:receptor-activated Ca2+-permeable cation channel [Guyanagaster necrorhizus MCA 3950]KAG7444146.1 receptor-activated Ca2+-permeable cation channel [Guyanagaster necrorhizus MCA 3950]
MDPEDCSSLLAPTAEQLAAVKVFPLIISLKSDILKQLDAALSWDQLTASDINFAVVRPIVFKYSKLQNMAVVYACLVVRSYFLNEAEEDLAYSGLMQSRAMFCEILAIKLLNNFANNYIQLVAVLTTTWNPLAGAPSDIVDEVRQVLGGDDDDLNSPQSALEMAISSESKHFLSCPVSQKVVNDIYSGRVVFSTAAHRSVLADNYKSRAIEVYDCRKAPFLDHYRLRVPRYGSILEFLNFAVLLCTFILCLTYQDLNVVTGWEIAFCVCAAAFVLEEYTAATEHGWSIYIANTWNAFDFSFILIFLIYLGLRIRGIAQGNPDYSDTAFDVLACGACILIPRLAFFAVSNNVVVLSLREMISQFVFFIGIAAICFSGLLFTLWRLGNGTWSVKRIAWLMVQIWFGNTYLSFGQAESFHPLFGPILMTSFAALSNTLLLTILISILSNTVARIDANATQEYLFQYAISTIEGVQSDALFSYQPPFNILAFIILKPASWFLSPRALHTTNVFLTRVTSFPILVVIGVYERYFASGQRFRESGKGAAQTLFSSLPRHIKNMPIVEAIVGSTSNDLYEAIFEVDAERDLHLFDEEEEELPHLRSVHSQENLLSDAESRKRRQSSVRRPPSAMSGPKRLSPQSSPRTPRARNLDLLSAEVQSSLGSLNPLQQLFGRPSDSPQVEAAVKKVEALVDDLRNLPVHKLSDEMRELQERQARIESLLLMLTRGMRNETASTVS